MAVCRVEKSRNYTVMSNYHLRDKRLSLKTVGLLSKMLSLPEDWDYTTRGLAAICKDGVDAIGAALKELELNGYLIRRRVRDSRGCIRHTEYIIYETPHTASPDTENPYLDIPDTACPDTDNPAQLNIDKTNTKELSMNKSSTHSIPFREESKRKDTKQKELEKYRTLIRKNIEYELIIQDKQYETDCVDEIVQLMVETVCTEKKLVRVAGEDYPADTVKARLLQLNGEHIRFVLDCMKENTTQIRNIRQYLLASLWNAPTTIGSYYFARVNHDLSS